MTKTPGIKQLAKGRSDIFRIAPQDIIVRPGWNFRDFESERNKEHVRALAASIRENGVKEPLSGYVEDGKFVLTNGESRYRAVMHLINVEKFEVETVPVQTEPRHATEADLYASQFIRNSGASYDVMENARLFAKLKELGWEANKIAEKFGLTPERVYQLLKLSTVPEETQRAVSDGKIGSTTVQRIQAKAKTSEEINASVKAAIKTAESQGKKKATPKHVEKAAPAKKKVPGETSADKKAINAAAPKTGHSAPRSAEALLRDLYAQVDPARVDKGLLAEIKQALGL